MTMKPFKPSVEEDLNRLHNVTLTEGQISTILYILEGYNPLDSDGYDPECSEDIDKIFEVLEGAVDNFYDGYSADDVTQCVIDTNGDYAECVDRLVDSMEITEFQENLEVNKFIRDNQ
tara:strand:- start:1371 stop:1724 length:354 start_codon:yes stop_codon:yes gene_type:complete